MLISGCKGKLLSIQTIFTPPAAFSSYHLSIMMKFTLRNELSVRARELILPMPHRLKSEAGKLEVTLHVNELPIFTAKLRTWG